MNGPEFRPESTKDTKVAWSVNATETMAATRNTIKYDNMSQKYIPPEYGGLSVVAFVSHTHSSHVSNQCAAYAACTPHVFASLPWQFNKIRRANQKDSPPWWHGPQNSFARIRSSVVLTFFVRFRIKCSKQHAIPSHACSVRCSHAQILVKKTHSSYLSYLRI